MKNVAFLSLPLLVAFGCTPSDSSEPPPQDLPGIEATVTFQDVSVESRVVEIGPDYFQPGSVTAYLGRLPVEPDFSARARPVTVLSHSLWLEFGGEPNILGAAVQIGESSRIVVGVTPPEWAESIGPVAWVSQPWEGVSPSAPDTGSSP